jgi:hypothetical protein
LHSFSHQFRLEVTKVYLSSVKVTKMSLAPPPLPGFYLTAMEKSSAAQTEAAGPLLSSQSQMAQRRCKAADAELDLAVARVRVASEAVSWALDKAVSARQRLDEIIKMEAGAMRD